MDADVIAAMAKWPNVPAVFGWLELTARGQWLIKGEAVRNEPMRAFIGRNYQSDAGRWYFQNGPQRVYVDLELAPLVYRIGGPQPTTTTHIGVQAKLLRAVTWIDAGRMVIDTELGPGNIDDRDGAALLAAVCDAAGRSLDDEVLQDWLQGQGSAFLNAAGLGLAGGAIEIERIESAAVSRRFGFDPRPRD